MLSKNIIFIFILIYLSFPCAGKWKVYTKYRGYDSVYYAFHDDYSNIIKNGKNVLTFYPLNVSENIIKSAERPFKKYKKGILPGVEKNVTQNYYSWTINLTAPVAVTDDMVLYYNIYTEGIDSLSIWIKSGDMYFVLDKVFETDYYQLPEEMLLRSFVSVEKKDTLKKGSPFEQIILLIHKKNNVKKHECVVGDLKLYQSALREMPAKGLFFYELTKNEDNYPVQKQNKYISYGLGINSTINNPISNQYYFELESDDNKEKNILELLYSILDHYPYFKERNIDRDDFLNGVNSILQDSVKSFSDKIEFIKNQISSIHDPHFFFDIERKDDIRKIAELPFRIGRHFKGFFITAISNSCPKDITVGMQVTHIDSINLEILYDSLSLSPTSVQSVANRISGNIATLKTADGRSITVTKQISVKYPSNYYKPLREFRVIDNKYVYFSFKGWTFKDYLYFTNKLRDIDSRQIDAFIFDLRNNPGGEMLVAISIASMFVDRPCVFDNHSYLHEGALVMESDVMIPHQDFQFAGKQVILLVNSGTACGSEIFVANMKKYANAVIIGQEKTAGAFAALQNFYLPDGISLSTNMLSKIESPYYQIENKGILPDVYVYPYNPEDLFPHNDKIFQQALEYLRFTE